MRNYYIRRHKADITRGFELRCHDKEQMFAGIGIKRFYIRSYAKSRMNCL